MKCELLMVCPTCGKTVGIKWRDIFGMSMYPLPDCPDCPVPATDDTGYGKPTLGNVKRLFKRIGLDKYLVAKSRLWEKK